jgi:hypothetical protein
MKLWTAFDLEESILSVYTRIMKRQYREIISGLDGMQWHSVKI